MSATHIPASAAILLLAAISVWAAGPAQSWKDTLSIGDCGRLDPSDGIARCDCYLAFARRYRQWEEASQLLSGSVRRDANDRSSLLCLGMIEADRGRPGAEAILRDAARRFDGAGDLRGGVVARLQLSALLRRAGRVDEARIETEHALRLVEPGPDAELHLRLDIERGFLALEDGDYGGAWVAFKNAEARLSHASGVLRPIILDGLGAVAAAAGRDVEAIECFAEEAELRAGEGDYLEEARIRYNIALLSRRMSSIGELPMSTASSLTTAAVDAALRAGSPDLETASRCLRAQDPTLTDEEAARESARALDLARRAGRPDLLIAALRQDAISHLDPDQPEPALRRLEESIALARRYGNPTAVARSRLALASALLSSGSREDAVERWLEALDSIEAIRDMQRDELVRSRTFAEWTHAYYQLAGLLLSDESGEPPRDRIELAFMVSERMRARVLLDAVDAARAAPASRERSGGSDRRNGILDRISTIQRQLAAGDLPAADVGRALEEIERLEVAAVDLANQDEEFVAARADALKRLDDIERSLPDDTAILAYVVSEPERIMSAPVGGSWLFCVTRGGTRVFPLPGRRELEAAVTVFNGLVQRRDGAETSGAARLYRDLVQRALEFAGRDVSRLVILPDGPLHRLPFDALKRSAEAPPLAATHQISVAPSAALWTRWRESSKQSLAGNEPAIAFVDPGLPGAVREVRDLFNRRGSTGQLLAGSKASEAALALEDTRRYGLLHFAVHIVVDEIDPARSALLLAPGSPLEDGLLQVREILQTHLDRPLVVLAGCRSASGATLEGEGVLSLSRAFLQAGASGVIGSLWPLRDDDAANVLGDFYEGIGRGASAGEALAGAKRRALSAGAPAAAWSGVVLFGDDTMRPCPAGAGGRAGTGEGMILLLIAGIIAALAIAARAGRSFAA